MLVGQHLHLHVPRPLQVALQVDLGAAEVGLSLTRRRLHRLRCLVGRLHDLHAAPTAAVGGLDGDRPAVLLAEGHHLVRRGQWLGTPGDPGNTGLLGGEPGADFVAHHLNGLRGRPNEGDAPLGDGPGEVGVLREEAVTGVYGVGAALLYGVENGLGVEVALRCRLAAEGVGLVGHADMQGVSVEVGIHGHRADAELAARPDHPNGDFTTICN